MSGFSTAKAKKINPLDKVIKKNPKYEHIQSTLDTGSSITKYLKRIEEIKTNYRYQQDEIFKRMKITTFVQLLLQVAEVDSVEKDSRMGDFESDRSDMLSQNANSLAQMTDRTISPVPGLVFENSEATSRSRHSTLQGVIRGIGEYDVYEKNYEREKVARKFAHAERNLIKLQQDLDLPYLLLDLRTRDEYDQCHMISALSYPIAMLSRSINNETPELLAYKNQPGKIIAVYDDDEKIGTKAATTLVERGYDNLFLLSGGLKLAYKRFPEGLIVGAVPVSFAAPKTPGNQRNLISSASSEYSTASSNISNVSKKTFDRDDIEKLNQYLDENLIGSETQSRYGGSRASTQKSSRASQAASIASNRTITSIHEKPWKPT